MSRATLTKLLWKVGRYPLLLICVVFFTYFLSNIPAFYKSVAYLIKAHVFSDKVAEASDGLAVAATSETLKFSDINKKHLISDNQLVIPRISVKAPIAWQINNRESDIQKSLKSGVANIAGTALPGEGSNVFITGHSSNYLWSDGDYKTIFSLLGQLQKDDLIYLRYRGNLYVYKVYDQVTVRPKQVEYMGDSDKSILSLMTCTPIGTTINRLIVRADQVYPIKKSSIRSKYLESN